MLGMLGTTLGMLCPEASAQGAPVTPVGPVATLTIAPANAAPGVVRTIHVDTLVPQGCEPRSARVDATAVAVSRTLVVHLSGAPGAQAPCGGSVARRYSVTYAPEEEGDLSVLAVTEASGTLSGVLAQAALVTRATPSVRSRFDLTGMWFDPASYGSGLTFVHAAARNDAVFGTWFLYDSSGMPRWYTIQYVNWKPGGLEAEGTLFDSSAPLNLCPLTVIGCPLAAAAIAPLGRVRIALETAERARVEAIGSDGRVIFVSRVVRATI
jgi:hypothetical protein